MKRIIYLSFFVALAANLTGCDWFKKHEDNTPKTPEQMLPPITQTGANTFGCLINGELMLAINKCRTCPSNPNFDPTLGLQISAYMDTSSTAARYFVSLDFDDIGGTGIYSLDTIAKPELNRRIRNSVRVYKYSNPSYMLSTIDSGTFCRGELNISKWQRGPNPYVSGTFWFDLYNPDRYADTVHVRSGRFDVPL